MPAITSAGLGSGLDIEGLVSKLVAAEGQAPSVRLATKEANLQADLSALGSLKGALSSFQASVQGLKELSSFKVRTATSSNAELFTVTADSTAVAGSFSIKVEQLAQTAKMRSADLAFASDSALVGGGTLTTALGATGFTVTTEATTTLAGVRDAINQAADNPGISASIVKISATDSRLVLTSTVPGAANTLGITATPTIADPGNDLTRLATANLIAVQPPLDAVIQVDGQSVTRSSNSFADVISGVSIALKKADPLTTGTLSVTLDKDSAKSKVNEFINAYNSLAGAMNGLSSYNAQTKQAARLFGDTTLRGVQNQLQQVLSASVQNVAGISTLSEIGIKTNKGGVLVLDTAKLDSVLAAKPEAVSQLFASGNGLAKRLDTVLTNYLSSDGALSSRVDGVNKQISGITLQRDRLNIRLTDIEARYRRQFTAMDTLLGQLQNIGSFLTQQLANLPGYTNKTN
jgi:flagellar hook-associated protein 2